MKVVSRTLITLLSYCQQTIWLETKSCTNSTDACVKYPQIYNSYFYFFRIEFLRQRNVPLCVKKVHSLCLLFNFFSEKKHKLFIVSQSAIYSKKYISISVSWLLAGHHNNQMPSYRTQFSRKQHLASWQTLQALVPMILELQLGLVGCWGSMWAILSFQMLFTFGSPSVQSHLNVCAFP